MSRTLSLLLDIMRLRSGPHDLPAGGRLTLFLAALYLAGGFFAARVLDEPDYAPQTIVAIAVQFGIITVLLNLRNLRPRVPQTISALSGTGFIFGLMSIFLLSRIDVEAPQVWLAALYFALFFWNLTVDGHIYRHALSSKMGTGVLIAVMIFAVNFMLLRALFS